MSEHELEKLLGGFAADTLTQEEQQRLFTAALQDQQLFNALADEQALKELLADPAVRRRLLDSVRRSGAAASESPLSWLDMLRRPAGLAFAGGIAAAVFAVVLGTKMYQDSLNRAAQSVRTEDTAPAVQSPPASSASQPEPPRSVESLAKTKDNSAKIIEAEKKAKLAEKSVKRERAEVPPSKEQRDEAGKQAHAPATASGGIAEELPASTGPNRAAFPAPPTAAPKPQSMQTPMNATKSNAAARPIGARALFYADKLGRSDLPAVTAEQEQTARPHAEAEPHKVQPDRKMDRFAATGKAAGSVARLQPLGLRYSLVLRGAEGREREVDAATALNSAEPVSLAVETNQDAYLQIWKTVSGSMPELLFPEKATGRISEKIMAGQRRIIPLPVETAAAALIVRLSRSPFGPITRQEAAMFERPSPDQLQESIAPGGPSGSEELATYVVNQDPSPTAQIAATILFGRS